jgi:hypothetical protein
VVFGNERNKSDGSDEDAMVAVAYHSFELIEIGLHEVGDLARDLKGAQNRLGKIC